MDAVNEEEMEKKGHLYTPDSQIQEQLSIMKFHYYASAAYLEIGDYNRKSKDSVFVQMASPVYKTLKYWNSMLNVYYRNNIRNIKVI